MHLRKRSLKDDNGLFNQGLNSIARIDALLETWVWSGVCRAGNKIDGFLASWDLGVFILNNGPQVPTSYLDSLFT